MTFSDPANPVVPEGSRTPDFDAGAPEIPPRLPEPEHVPEDIRTPWGGVELLLLLGFALGSLIFLEVILEVLLVVHFHMTRDQLVKFLGTNAAFAVGFQAFWSGIIFLFLFLMIRQYNHAPFWSSLRWRKIHSRNRPAALVYIACGLGGVALAFLIAISSRFVGEKKNLPIEQLFRTRSDVIWLMVFGIVFAPFFEETVFRGYLYPVFARKWGIPTGIFTTGLLFGLMHAIQLWGGWVQISLLILVGIILTVARARTGSVVASYLMHVCYNTVLFAGYVIGTHGLTKLPPVH